MSLAQPASAAPSCRPPPSVAPTLDDGWRAAANPVVLSALTTSTVDLAVWRRPVPDQVTRTQATWAETKPAGFERLIAPTRDALAPAVAGLPVAARAWVHDDLADLIERLGSLAAAPRLRVWFGPVRGDQCRKFHVDYVRYRLITTYVGPGTEWVPPGAVARAALEHPPDCPCDANRAIVPDGAAVQHAAIGDVLVMKGALHPDGRGVVHRSPPIAGTGVTRVVLIASAEAR